MSDSTSLFDLAMARLRRSGAALGGAVLLTLPVASACLDPAATTSMTAQDDWAQFEGVRDTRMVSFTGTWTSSCAGQNTRFGCGSIGIQLSVRVKPNYSANLDYKRVGVVYRSPDDLIDHTAIGHFVQTLPGGDEEWSVGLTVSSQQSLVVFDAWYQDGANHTYIDDNQGEFHVVNAGPAYNVVRAEPWLNQLVVDGKGARGKLSVQIENLDYDKQLELVATTDGWATTLHFGSGVAGDANLWTWTENLPPGRERWQIDLDVPGDVTTFEYAIVYRHGVVNGAHTYEFWDNNNGSNYRVDRTTTP